MRRLTSLIALTLLAPSIVLALNYTPTAQHLYRDSRTFSTAEVAGISLLTNLGAVQGNPGNVFAVQRGLNRAEFAKILIYLPLLKTGYGTPDESDQGCFPDVSVGQWFTRTVCAAKYLGLVQGFPDGRFHPERPVLYAEALKMLGNLYDYTLDHQPSDEWFTPYVRAAGQHRTSLPISLEPGDPLTRGEMARLVAAFHAESLGELDLYRSAEQGHVISSSSSLASSSSSSSVASSFSSSSSSSLPSSSSSSSSSVALDLPSRSHFLILGRRSQPLADANFFAEHEGIYVQSATVVLKAKITSIDAMFLVDQDGRDIGQLSLSHYLDDSDKTWKGTFVSSGGSVISKGTQRVLAIEVRLNPKNNGGFPGQLVQVDRWSVGVRGQDSQSTWTVPAPATVYPKHETAQGTITAVANAGDTQSVLATGTYQVLGAFSFSAKALTGATVRLRNLEFQVSKAPSVAVMNWSLASPSGGTHLSCSVNGSTVSCSAIPPELGSIGRDPIVLRLYGDVAVDQGSVNPFLQVTLNQPGSLGDNGAVHWSDGASDYTWTELQSPIAKGTLWK
ncbi:S-layer homology domain-containing protein [Candidatus Peregrinibacteria bacterium]|nr:S-layer homology domain-containing protein [Candidatus Peregrinibacteria bacterium]